MILMRVIQDEMRNIISKRGLNKNNNNNSPFVHFQQNRAPKHQANTKSWGAAAAGSKEGMKGEHEEGEKRDAVNKLLWVTDVGNSLTTPQLGATDKHTHKHTYIL